MKKSYFLTFAVITSLLLFILLTCSLALTGCTNNNIDAPAITAEATSENQTGSETTTPKEETTEQETQDTASCTSEDNNTTEEGNNEESTQNNETTTDDESTVEDIQWIPDPEHTSEFSISDGIISKLSFYEAGKCGDFTGNAKIIWAGGACETITVNHKGKSYQVLGYRKSQEEGQALALDLSAYTDDDTLRNALSNGYTIEVAIQYTEEMGKKSRGIFASTQNGMFGIWYDAGYFKFEQYDTIYHDVTSKEKAVVGELYHLVGVYDAKKKTISLYVNGQLQGTTSVTGLTFGESPFIYCVGADIGYDKVITDYPNYPSVYTGAAIYDTTMKAAQVTEVYNDMLDALENPSAHIAKPPYNPSDEYYMQNVTVSGDVKAGGQITVSGELVNRSTTDRYFKLYLEHPLLSTSCAAENQNILIEASMTVPFSYTVDIKNGGSFLLRASLLSAGNYEVTKVSIPLIASGTGYYVGDAHTHSTLSDGKNDIAENFAAAYANGQAWMFATDHNFDLTQKKYANDAAALYPGFAALTGNEITTEVGHMLEYGTSKRHSGGFTGGMWEIMAAYRPDADTWQSVIDEIIAEGGACYLAHPLDWSNTGSWLWPGVGRDQTSVFVYSGFTGIEVYNADSNAYGFNPKNTSMALEFWDRYNLKGEHHYFGICNTDGHTDKTVCSAANALYVNAINGDTILETLKNGHFYGTNGPEIRFSINDASNGETLPLPEDGKATLSLAVADQCSYLARVVLYTYTMTGKVDEAYKNRKVEVLFDKEKDGDKNLFTIEKQLTVTDGQFYRVEVYSEKSLYGDYEKSGGFAFSNPIWIGKDIKANKEDNVPQEAERTLSIDKTTYTVGEDILVTASGLNNDSIAVYPVDFVPGHDASLYYAFFEGCTIDDNVITRNKPIKVTDIPGNNKGNWQANPYFDVLPVGNYKIVIIDENNQIVKRVDFTIKRKQEEEPSTDRVLTTDKTTYTVGEDIIVTAGGQATDWIAFYPEGFVPGKDACVYFAEFTDNETSIVPGTTHKLTELPGRQPGNQQVASYYDTLPAGNYTLLLLGEGYVIYESINIIIK